MSNRKVISPLTYTKDILLSGESIRGESPTVKDRKRYSFFCELESMDDGVLRLGQGYRVSSGCWAEITKNTVSVYNFYSYADPSLKIVLPVTELGFEIKDFLSVMIQADSAHRNSFINITTSGGNKRIELPSFSSDFGELFVMADGLEARNCKFNWLCLAYAEDIWVYGDSYLGFGHNARWPYYLYRDGFSELLLSGYPGMASKRGLTDFKLALQFGTPKYAAWCLGMNNGDPKDKDEPNSDWLACVEEFLDLCKENGITPILSTIPETPTVRNRAKNAWVKASGYRYIDFDHAVGADKDPSWYPTMLHSDNVHPAAPGAAALYAQVLIDFPEIMNA